ncbi:YjfB family protein [Paenibacillus thailandensis]|uniref:YjfB family protein n=1 Tax=Paenibacillus thailandensis TaxID=393250 RepID=A0ABW5QR66_9BACL
MDIAATSSAFSQAALMQAVSLRVMDMAQTQAQQQGDNLAQMMASVQPHIGRQLDIKV